jgi:hypothetical protein
MTFPAPNGRASVMTVPRLRALATAVEQFTLGELKYATTLESLGSKADREEITKARLNAAQASEALTIIMLRFPKQASALDKE